LWEGEGPSATKRKGRPKLEENQTIPREGRLSNTGNTKSQRRAGGSRVLTSKRPAKKKEGKKRQHCPTYVPPVYEGKEMRSGAFGRRQKTESFSEKGYETLKTNRSNYQATEGKTSKRNRAERRISGDILIGGTEDRMTKKMETNEIRMVKS